MYILANVIKLIKKDGTSMYKRTSKVNYHTLNMIVITQWDVESPLIDIFVLESMSEDMRRLLFLRNIYI